MLNPRILLIIVVALGFGLLGCSQNQSSDSASALDEGDGPAAAEESTQVKKQVRWYRNEAIVTELELTDDQIQAVTELMTLDAGDGAALRQQERRLGLRYLRALSQEPYDPALVERLSEGLTKALTSEHRRRIENVRGIRDILTQDQWTKLWQLAPRAVQVGRFRAARGGTIAVTDEDPNATPTPAP